MTLTKFGDSGVFWYVLSTEKHIDKPKEDTIIKTHTIGPKSHKEKNLIWNTIVNIQLFLEKSVILTGILREQYLKI